ncbi:MAG TPA: polysaccharide deacetylase family protein [Sedimentisphaerales bacterium]|nr:polysaccharide deacetylase family protein [Sedimentisphaerales bacterium]HRS11838.1 polysaccharide deacetylase family protein [Sedimentisphaerales bacterium]HRV48753.1 polysaccharide deacetylase family protein [Sedimentisphaerales bacterium]
MTSAAKTSASRSVGLSFVSALLSLYLAAATAPGASEPAAAKAFHWPAGQRGAVTLSYDDAIVAHFESVAPQLEKAGLRATFYIQIDSPGFRLHTDAWRKVARAGHELGNHSLFHPCRKDRPGEHAWLSDDYNLSNYTPDRWLGEMRIANLVLQLIDGKTERTFGNTCCNNSVGPLDNRTSLEELVPKLFVGARGEYISQPIDPMKANFAALGHYSGDGKSFEQLRDEIESAVREGQWVFYMFHGVGEGTHSLYIDADEHCKLVEYLWANKDRIWTAPAVDVLRHLKATAERSP